MRSKAVWLERHITDAYNDYEYLIYTICFHGAPALAGIKTGTMLCFTDSGRNMRKAWFTYRKRVSEDLHLSYCELRRCESGVTVLFYTPELVISRLADREVQAFLQTYGYEAMDIKQAMVRLRHRFREGCPHEIGVFLGYPLEDIIAFASEDNKDPCLMVGYWRVYGNLHRAQSMFKAYDEIRMMTTERLKEGVSPLSIISVLSAA